jgi:hypothetical protein
MLRTALPLAMIALLSSCVGPPKDRRPVAVAVPASPELRQCLGGLDQRNARYSLVAGTNVGGGCSTLSSIKLTVAGVPITNVTAIQCPLARVLTEWVEGPVQIAARRYLGSKVVRIDSFGAYSCRNVIGRASAANKRSEHATANAIDIGAFVLGDGRRVTVLGGWNGTPEERDFLRAVHDDACHRFKTVLSPEYNAAHADHLHFDMGRGPFCR